MCIIIDNNVIDLVMKRGKNENHDFTSLYDTLTGSKKRSVKIVYGGRLVTDSKEYARSRDVVAWLVMLDQKGRARTEEDAKVDAEERKVKKEGFCSSNDHHIIALARVSKARLLCTDDSALEKDFKNPKILQPKGHIYKTPEHNQLLTKHCH